MLGPLFVAVSHLTTLAAVVLASAPAPSHGASIFDARPPRVGHALPGMWAGAPIETTILDHPVPAAPSELVLTPQDDLAVHLPIADQMDGFMGSWHYNRMPQVDLANRRVTLDRYYRPYNQAWGPMWIDTRAVEQSLWIGTLPAGEYEMEVRDWTFPLPSCDSDTWATGICPAVEIDFHNAEFAATQSWNFTVVPEPTTHLLAGLAGLTGVWTRRASWIG